MTTPAEFKAIKELRQIDDAGISPDLLMLFESETESLNVLLSQLASYITKPIKDELIPPGVPQYWPGDAPPDGFAFINNGLTFNTVQYPRLAIAWPTGVIPPHKGLVIECTADGAVTGESEVGEVKLHNHSINHGHSNSASSSFSGNQLPTHAHIQGAAIREFDGGFDYGSATGRSRSEGTSGPTNINTHPLTSSNSAGTPSGTVSTSVNVNNHSGNSGSTGQSRNTVDRINYNVMVRLA